MVSNNQELIQSETRYRHRNQNGGHAKLQITFISFTFQLIQRYEIEVTFRKKYSGPYFHLHTENPFIKVISETYIDTRSKFALIYCSILFACKRFISKINDAIMHFSKITIFEIVNQNHDSMQESRLTHVAKVSISSYNHLIV